MRVYSASRSLTDAIRFSEVGVNVKYMKCEYPPEVMKKYHSLVDARR